MLAAGDPDRQVCDAPLARHSLDGLIDETEPARTLRPRWRGPHAGSVEPPNPRVARHRHSCGPVEGLNSLFKKLKCVAAGLLPVRQLSATHIASGGGCNRASLAPLSAGNRERPANV